MKTTNIKGRSYENTIKGRQRLMKERQVSDEYNLTLSWLRNARWKGNGPSFVKIGGSIFYRPEDLDAYIEMNLRSSTSEY